MTDTETGPITAATSTAQAMADIVMTMPAIRWLAVQKRYDVGLQQLMDNELLLLLVAANETHFQETGRNDWGRFEAMGLAELTEFFGLAAGDDATKSDDSDDTAGSDAGS